MGTIYVFRNKINNMPYVGQTGNFEKRVNGHKYDSLLIDKAIRKHGLENFEQLLLENVPEEELDYWEVHYIKEINSIFPYGYNFESGGHKNKHLSEETKRKISEAKIGKLLSEEHKKRLSNAKKLSVAKRGGSHLGKLHSKETKQKISNAMSGENHPNFGKHHSEDTKKKISAAVKKAIHEIK